jgi:SnoaL-like domain
MKGIGNMDELRLWHALNQLEIKYWYDVDYNGGSSVHELYCDDGLLSVGGKEFKSRHTIKTFYEWRRGRVETARHVISNLTVRAQDERRATSFGLITIYRARGIRTPLNTGNVPALVSDFTSECILCPNDVWRYASHVLRPVFTGPDTPFSLSIDPEFVAYLARSHDSGDRASADHVWATPQPSKEGDLNPVE